MKTWETICNIEKNNKLHIIFSRKMILRSSMMPLLCSLRSSFRGAGSRRYRPSSPASMVPCILSFVPCPLPLCFFVRYTSSFVMHPGSGLCFFTIEGSTTPSPRRRPLLHPCRRVQPTHRVQRVHTSFRLQCHLPPRTHRIA